MLTNIKNIPLFGLKKSNEKSCKNYSLKNQTTELQFSVCKLCLRTERK